MCSYSVIHRSMATVVDLVLSITLYTQNAVSVFSIVYAPEHWARIEVEPPDKITIGENIVYVNHCHCRLNKRRRNN